MVGGDARRGGGGASAHHIVVNNVRRAAGRLACPRMGRRVVRTARGLNRSSTDLWIVDNA
jgi:hypothetical protein